MSGKCSCLFHRIVDDASLPLQDPDIFVKFKSPADAFFAFIYLYGVVEVTDVRRLIQSVKRPNAGKTYKAIWNAIRAFVLAEGLTSKNMLRRIRSPEFLEQTTITTPGQIDAVVRTARRRLMIPSFDYVAGMPLVVLENVVDFMGSFVCNFARDSSRLRSERSYADDIRRDLAAMALVHRTWTHFARLVLRRRVALRSIDAIHKYMQNPNCGPWVQELVIDLPPPKVKIGEHSHSDDEMELCPACGDYHEEDDEDEEIEIDDEEDSFALPDPSSMWPSICMLVACVPNVLRLSVLMLYRTFDFYLSEVDTRGVDLFTKLLGRMKSLEGLTIRTLTFHDSSTDLSFANLCKRLSTLPNLRRLAIQGFDNVNVMDDRENKLPTTYPVSFEGVAPLQLRTLALSIADEPRLQSSSSLAWLLRSQEVLEDLFLFFVVPHKEGAWRTRFTSRMVALLPKDLHFPALRRFRLQVYDTPHILLFKGFFAKHMTAFFQKCTKLTELYITYSSMPKLTLPSSLVNLSLSFHHDRVVFGSGIEIFRKWDSKMVRLLTTNGPAKLRKLTIVMYCREPIVNAPKGVDMLRLAFGQTLKWCRDNRIEVAFEDETNSSMYFDERMNNFVFG